MSGNSQAVLALDWGAKRVGVALASLAASLASPLTTLNNSDDLLGSLQEIIERESVIQIVLGYPRGLNGQATAQSQAIERVSDNLKQRFNLPVDLQDEALTSVRAETELESRGRDYDRGEVDALAATYILEDWLSEHLKTSLRGK